MEGKNNVFIEVKWHVTSIKTLFSLDIYAKNILIIRVNVSVLVCSILILYITVMEKTA